MAAGVTGSGVAAAGAQGAGQGFERLSCVTWRQGGVSAVLAVAVVAWAWSQARYGWLCLFVAFSAVALCGQASLALATLIASEGRWRPWLAAWVALGAGILAGAFAGYGLVQGGTRLLVIETVTGPRLFGSLVAFGVLGLMLPLAYAQRQARALHVLNLEQAALSAELHSLQAQVEPHFLYNTLANARYLARHDPAQAVRMLDHLIAYLRTSVPDLRAPMSTLGRECELAAHYLALMGIRFGERLVIEVACPAPLQEVPIPPLMLMSLVENAVRHGVEPKPGPVCVRVSATLAGDLLAITVADNGAGLGTTVLGSGVGLRNVRERLAAMYGDAASVTLRTAEQFWTESVLVLPLQGRNP